MNKDELIERYQSKKEEIDSRLDDFKALRDSSEERKFKELIFVVLTSQTHAEKAWEACEDLDRQEILLKGSEKDIEQILSEKDVTYPENKSKFIVSNRENLSQPTLQQPEKGLKISQKINEEDLESSREWFAENMKGISWKGASHFLRNIGYGNGFAIISGHIAMQMHELGLTESTEPPKNKKDYLKREKELQKFAEDISIDIKALDLVLWSAKTGKVFK